MSGNDQKSYELSVRVQSLEAALLRQSTSNKQLLQKERKQAALNQELEKEIKRIKRAIFGPHVSSQGKWARRFAEHIDSIVGLKEALTWRRTPLRIVWACLVLLGMAGTIYYIYENTVKYYQDNTATKMTLDSSAPYTYPPLVICPPWWFDADRLFSEGLKPDALAYSLAETRSHSPINNFSKGANVELAKFFKRQNLSSMIEYVKWMADSATYLGEDLSQLKNASKLNQSVTYYCRGCDETRSVDVIVSSTHVCYVFYLRPATFTHPSQIAITNFDKTKGFLDGDADQWLVDILPNIAQNSLNLRSMGLYILKIGAQRIKRLRSCIDDPSPVDDLSLQTRCVIQCLNEWKRKAPAYSSFEAGGRYFSFEAGGRPTSRLYFHDPSFYAILSKLNETAENMTYAPSTNLTRNPDTTLSVSQWEAAVAGCLETCKEPPCDRTLYTFEVNHRADVHTAESQKGMSILCINLLHTAITQGGLFTFEEVDTLSFSEFISNVGGTFGLFLGCTMMTLAQFILSLVSYVLDDRKVINSAGVRTGKNIPSRTKVSP